MKSRIKLLLAVLLISLLVNSLLFTFFELDGNLSVKKYFDTLW